MSISLTGARNVPDVVWEYWGITTFMLDNPGTYGMDNMRADCHSRLCEHYNLTKDATRQITDHLDRCDTAIDLHCALIEIQEKEHEDE